MKSATIDSTATPNKNEISLKINFLTLRVLAPFNSKATNEAENKNHGVRTFDLSISMSSVLSNIFNILSDLLFVSALQIT